MSTIHNNIKQYINLEAHENNQFNILQYESIEQANINKCNEMHYGSYVVLTMSIYCATETGNNL